MNQEVIDQNLEQEQPEEEIVEERPDEEDFSDDESDEMPVQPEETQPTTRKKGKPRNKRLVDKIRRLEDERNDMLVRMATLESMVSGHMPTEDSNQNLSQSYPQQSYEVRLKEERLNSYMNDLKDYLVDNEDAAEAFEKSPYQLRPEVIAALPDERLSPQKLHNILKHFPKSVRRLNMMDGRRQLSELLRLDGKLDAISEREDMVSQRQKVPQPTGYLKGESVSVSSKKTPAELADEMRDRIYNRK